MKFELQQALIGVWGLVSDDAFRLFNFVFYISISAHFPQFHPLSCFATILFSWVFLMDLQHYHQIVGFFLLKESYVRDINKSTIHV